MAHFIHRPSRNLDPAFLREERRYLEHEYATLHVMERHREHLAAEIEHARQVAHAAHIPFEDAGGGGPRLAVIGVGNRMRRDDAAGLEVARRLLLARPAGVSVLEQGGEPASLLESWAGLHEALVADAVSSGAEPGTIHRFDASAEPLPTDAFGPSSHALGLAEAIELGRELERLPERLVVYGIEGHSFDHGEGLTERVETAVATLVTELHRDLEAAP